MKLKKFKITYTETLLRTSIIFAEGEADASYKFDNNEDEEREVISSIRNVENIRNC